MKPNEKKSSHQDVPNTVKNGMSEPRRSLRGRDLGTPRKEGEKQQKKGTADFKISRQLGAEGKRSKKITDHATP